MASEKPANGAAAATAKRPAAQRSIASFFGSKPPPAAGGAGVKKAPPSKAKGVLEIPSAAAETPAKRGRMPDEKPGRVSQGVDSAKAKGNASPTDSHSPGSEAGPKSKGWVSTPSPSEPSRPVNKSFGRKDKKASKTGFVAPVANSTVDNPAQAKQSKNNEPSADPEALIGRRLKIYWPLDKAWYPGRVISYKKSNASHVIEYDDGEQESMVLKKEKVKWLDDVDDDMLKTPKPRKSTARDSPLSSGKEDGTGAKTLVKKRKTKEGDFSGNRSQKGLKRARSDVDDESPATIVTVTNEIFDEVDVAAPAENREVKVRKRLRKMSGGDPGATADEGREIESLQEDEDLSPEKSKGVGASRRLKMRSGKGDSKTSPSSAVVSGCERADSDDSLETPPSESPDDQRTIQKRGSRDNASATSSIKPQSKSLFFKPRGNSANGPASVPVSSKKGTSPVFRDTVETPKVLEADKVTKGELHSTLMGEAAERFGGRIEEKFKFLGRDRKDGSGRRPSDPNYDPRTVRLSPEFLKALSAGQRQWWEFKAKHMDKVLFFKMGKFYELFEMDAHVGAQELDLQYMKGDQPHCGFPEKIYAENAEKLTRKGYRVLVVEQTETPDQLERRRQETGAKDKVVRREVCAILTKGTLVDGEMLLANPDAAYLMSIYEMDSVTREPAQGSQNCVTIGVCFVDTSTSQIQLGQFVDDSSRSRVRSILAEMRPVEIIKSRDNLLDSTERAIRDHTRQPLVNILAPGIEFWDAKGSLKEILKLYTTSTKGSSSSRKSSGNEEDKPTASQLELLPEALQQIVGAGSHGEAALSALGGSLFYLREALLDQTVLKLGRVDLLQGSDPLPPVEALASSSMKSVSEEAGDLSQDSKKTDGLSWEPREPHMMVDSDALENLEILENNRDGGPSGTLFAYLNTCVTPCGRRLLKQWLVRPLMRIEPIVQRQLALSDLKNVGAEARLAFRKELKSQPDVERLVARLNASSGASGRNGENVVLYEDAAKKLLHEFLSALSGCRALLQAIQSFESCLSDLKSDRLRRLLSPGHGVPDMAPVIERLETAFDRVEAASTGRIVPREGVDEDFDKANSTVDAATEKLDEYLNMQRKKFNNSSEIKYVTVGKEPYQIEIPEKFHAKLPSSYENLSSRKGFRRYWTPEIKEYLQELSDGKQQRELALKNILQGLVRKFCEDTSKWLSLVKAVAEVDVLISLAESSVNSAPTCRPTFIEEELTTHSSSSGSKVVAKGLRHPTVSVNLSQGGAFVPNDIGLGGDDPPFMLLTGPNMGGKSTLMRQVCLAVVLAQIGADVPADDFKLSPVDRMFVRMGAKDMIMAGQSTFLVELSETAAMLRSATCRSLVALDELGRGTSTSDGQAIAHSVLQHLSHEVGCRGIFSTHYHRLADHFNSDSNVGLHHMSCKVGIGEDGIEEVLFLYKLAAGPCPKSYGVNVARLAGMPESVLRRAADRAGELELAWGAVAAHDKCKNLEMTEGSDGPSDQPHQSDSETEQMKEVCAILKQLSADETSTIDSTSLLQLWREAKQILLDSSEQKRGVATEAVQSVSLSA